MVPQGVAPNADGLQRRGRSSTGRTTSNGRAVEGKDGDQGGPGSVAPGSHAGVASNSNSLAHSSRVAGVSGHPQSYYMTPDTRSWILHRNTLATGRTGVEDVTAAAVLASQEAPTGQADSSHLRPRITGSGSSGGSLTVPVSAQREADVRAMGDTKYDLVSFVQHSGSLGGGHYIAHAKHRGNSLWYSFDDSYVDEISPGAVAGKEAYLLFYIRRRTPRYSPVPLPPSDDKSPLVYVSRAWWLRYCTLSVPGPISCADILCDHGRVKCQLAESISFLTVPLHLNQYNVLAAAYGAVEPPLLTVCACEECVVEAAVLDDRRRRENSNIQAVDTTSLQTDQVGRTITNLIAHS
jgi:hypothetical protein